MDVPLGLLLYSGLHQLVVTVIDPKPKLAKNSFSKPSGISPLFFSVASQLLWYLHFGGSRLDGELLYRDFLLILSSSPSFSFIPFNQQVSWHLRSKKNRCKKVVRKLFNVVSVMPLLTLWFVLERVLLSNL